MDRRFIEKSCQLDPDENVCGADFSSWKRRSLVRLDVVAKIGALLVAGFAAEGQDLIWVTDEDDFAANDERVTEATKLFGHYINHLSPVFLGHLRFGATSRVEDGSLFFEDLSAISDLAAGAMAVVMNEELSLERPPNAGLKIPMGRDAVEKSRLIVGWLSSNEGPLTKLAIYISLMPDGACRTGAVTLDGPSADALRLVPTR